MKKSKVILCAILLAFMMVTPGFAVDVQFTYTADNQIIAVWYQDGSTIVSLPLGPGFGSWSQVDTFTLNLDIGTEYQIIWQTENWSWQGAPGGFLGELSSSAPLIVGSLLSSAKWEIAFVKDNLAC